MLAPSGSWLGVRSFSGEAPGWFWSSCRAFLEGILGDFLTHAVPFSATVIKRRGHTCWDFQALVSQNKESNLIYMNSVRNLEEKRSVPKTWKRTGPSIGEPSHFMGHLTYTVHGTLFLHCSAHCMFPQWAGVSRASTRWSPSPVLCSNLN